MAICAAICLSGLYLTLLLANIKVVQILFLKAQDARFLLRGPVPTHDIVIVGIDTQSPQHFPGD